ncbi:hypothetical protein [Porphyrobacter sp. LM 6]|uniref:hypothetical protein n=1 Tax=Porphyrobacter sp. LM 6 TaxID=1896196 RepID=UPI00086399E6|nr:hypothetical protein [Porphyrobacter sp. LM 6]AOL94867.1 hypothetical protein BG023_111949 [Porphyrobacter sp. LM 6]
MLDLEVEFPKPCDERWEAMAPRGCNRHCASCDKIIHDLSALTLEEAERLLDGEDEVCVRAQIAGDGTIALRSSGKTTARRMIAVAGASLALATAACQTTPDSAAPRYQITGKFAYKGWYYDAELVSADGRSWPKRREAGTGRFIFYDLPPGNYTLSTIDTCGERVDVETFTITNASLEAKKTYPESGCIIVGAMVKVERPERA